MITSNLTAAYLHHPTPKSSIRQATKPTKRRLPSATPSNESL
ncbi:MAG: hypothetical protein WAT46_14445 [Saprospiraceae bacterium]